MATGRFGRRRGGSSNLAALVASLLREQRAAEDRAIFDAYSNGGLYKGKPVTDSRILSYIQGRRDGFSREDPLWDEWNNRHTQTRFSIGEQKIGLAFRQGKVGAGAVAAFYRGELKNIPKDSAFYRDVAGRAAQWAKSAAGAARGRARGSATQGLRQKLNAQLEQQQEYLGLEAALTEYARREGIISGTMTLADADATELQGMFDRGLYAGETRITFEDFTTGADKHFRALTSEIQTRLSLGQQAVEPRKKRTKFLNETIVRLNAVDERAQYEMAREDWISATDAAGNDPWAMAQANKAYADVLAGIHENASAPKDERPNDPEFIGGLVNEYEAIATGTSKGKTVADLYGMDDGGGSGKEQAASASDVLYDLDAMESGRAYFGQSEANGPMGVVEWPRGIDRNSLGLDDSLQPSITSFGGQRRLVYLKGESVTASVIRDINGNVVDPKTLDAATFRQNLANGTYSIEAGDEVGYVFSNPANGQIKYGVRDPQTGNMLFTDTNPWASDPVAGGSGLTVFASAVIERGDREFPDVSSVLTRKVSIDTFDPLLSDTTVAPKDMLALAQAGIKGFTDEDLASYKSRLQRQEELRRQRASGGAGFGGFGGPRQTFMSPVDEGGADESRRAVGVQQSMMAGMDAVAAATRATFMADASKDDKLFMPPPPPKPPAVQKDDLFTPPPTTPPIVTGDKKSTTPVKSSEPTTITSGDGGGGTGTWTIR